MNYVRVVGLVLAFSLMCIPGSPVTIWAYEDTQCFQCHTSAKQMIEITREIAKARPAVTSEEIQGEG